MNAGRRTLFWLAGGLLAGLLLYLLRDVLLPFAAGMAVAYLLNPLAGRLERLGASRTIATSIITAAFILAMAGGLFLVVPLIADQFAALVVMAPQVVDMVWSWAEPLLAQVMGVLAERGEDTDSLREALGSQAGALAGWVQEALGGLWSGGLALLHVLSLLLITPVVAFYLLRDWNRMMTAIDAWLPRPQQGTIRRLAAETDRSVAGFLRGQLSVCLILGLFYAVGLTVAGLNGGILVGLFAGLLSFIPYLGAITGFVVAVGLALVQFSEWLPVLVVAAIFLAGQALETNFLTPRLVGGRIGVHPVWILFALMAGGTVFGFVGVLLAVPAAAVLAVLIRFALERYRDGPLYTGDVPEQGTEPEEGAGTKP